MQMNWCSGRFALSRKLITNYFANSHTQSRRIGDNLHEYLPNLESIILTSNNIQEFSDLDPLLTLPKLETLSLLTNPITTNGYYREYMAYR